MDENPDPTSLANTPPRRRRRRSAASSAAPSLPERKAAQHPLERGNAPPSLWQRWGHRLASFGLSAAFRAYLFVGSIAAILAFLIYSEYVIREFKGQAAGQVSFYADLLALAYSPEAPSELITLIFKEILDKTDDNSRGEFPQIHTDHKGNITIWKGQGLPDQNAPYKDLSPEDREKLHLIMARMDAEYEPITYPISEGASGLLHFDAHNFVITDFSDDIVGWRGPNLPAEDDTSATAEPALRAMIEQMDADTPTPPHPFIAPLQSFTYLYHAGTNFVIADSAGVPISWRGADLPPQDTTSEADQEAVHAAMLEMATHNDPYIFRIAPESLQIHFGDPDLVSQLEWATYVQIGVLVLFVLIGYVGFRNIRRSEQRSIWVGMAKETAHQLGTPLSSLSGWLELIERDIQSAADDNPAAALERIDQKIVEMQKDMRHLNQVASRFSQIGSVPELKLENLEAVLTETINYFQSRSPQFGRHEIAMESQGIPPVPANAELLSWAFENLFKNAIDAFDQREGAIHVHLGTLPDREAVQLTFQDNGRGIAPQNVSQVFEPGFSTKKRGWGLGLAFVKRIVEEYHNGRITVSQSVPGEGTTFEIILPIK